MMIENSLKLLFSLKINTVIINMEIAWVFNAKIPVTLSVIVNPIMDIYMVSP